MKTPSPIAHIHTNMLQTTGKTLEEIDYIFASPALKDRMDAQGRGPARSASDSADEEKVTTTQAS